MRGALHSLKQADLPHYSGKVIKGYVTSLTQNEADVYWYDIAAVRAPQHAHIEALLGERSRTVSVVGRLGLSGDVLLRFEADHQGLFVVEMETFDGFDPGRKICERIADGLWCATNQPLNLQTEHMLSRLFIRSDEQPNSPVPDRQWARVYSPNCQIEPTSFSAVIEQYHR